MADVKAKTRRGHGSGAVYQIASGKWEALLDLGYITGPDGKRKRKRAKRVRDTERAAIEALDELKRAQHLGTLQTGKSPRLADYLQEWIEDNSGTRWRPNTVRTYSDCIKRISATIGHVRLSDLRPAHVEGLLNGMAETATRGYIDLTRSVLRSALNDARRNDLVTRNAAGDARPPRQVKTESVRANPLSPHELPRFLAAASEHVYGSMLTLAVYSGLRMGELRGLKWEDLELDAKPALLSVRRQIQNAKGGGWKEAPPKTDTGTRTLPLPAAAVAALTLQHRCQLEQRVFAGARWKEQGFVFTNSKGDPLHTTTLAAACKATTERAGLSHRRFHDLRHSFASYLISHGADLLTVKELCGHATIQVTANVYAHLFPNRKAEVMAVWDRLEDVAS